MKIVARLALGFGALVLLISGLSAYSVYSGRIASQETARTLQLVGNQAKIESLEKAIFEGRMRIWMALASGDATKVGEANEFFAEAYHSIQELRDRTIAPERIAKIDGLKTLLDDYVRETGRLTVTAGVAPSLAVGETEAAMAAAGSIGGKLDTVGDDLTDNYHAVATQVEEDTLRHIDDGIRLSMVVGLFSVALGVVLSLLIGRSVSHPVVAMTEAMEKLACGDTSIDIPAEKRADEIGAMAKTVRVFKDNMIRVAELQAEQEAAKLRAEQDRRQMMIAMADSFEAKVMGLVQGVSSQASQMEAASQNMSGTAEEAQTQAAAIAAAAEQATANVETVAAATEELSASIAEIGRQVADAATISSQASEDTERTNAMVLTLSQATDRIGEVVDLINTIASRTNLLALNATIEAARAGEAGKGFAVVANEVKHLANQTAKATDEIGTQIGAVQDETRRAVEAIGGIARIIERMSRISAGIAGAVEQQSAATLEITRSVHDAVAGTQEVTSRISGIAQAAATTGAASQQVLAAAGELAEGSGILRSEMVSFLDGVRAH